jgi:hypothetical protein
VGQESKLLAAVCEFGLYARFSYLQHVLLLNIRTTFLDDVHQTHKCTYIRQYHSMRPYIVVSKIPNFDPTDLPFWEIYENEGVADHIKAGGTLAGKFTQGLSGGQRKLLLFELVCQRTRNQKDLLIALDEPFSGVTDDFVPFIKDRLHDLKKKHNIVLVTNDHVETLTDMANNTITVSAVDRSIVRINEREVNREKAILALALGERYTYASSGPDFKFFFDVEVLSGSLLQILYFAIVTFSLYLATFWDSNEENAPLVLIAGSIIAFFNINPYLLSLVEWRNSMLEESEALVHSSANMNRVLKVILTMSVIFVLSVVEFGVVNAVIDGLFLEFRYWLAMLCDSASLTLPLVCLGLYTRLPFQTVQIVGSSPFLLMVFASTTFSPGAGVPVLKELRYLFPRFYWWCIVPEVQNLMEGCPPDNVIPLYLVLSAFVGVFILCFILGIGRVKTGFHRNKRENKREEMLDDEFEELQSNMYGEKALRRLRGNGSSSADETQNNENDENL